ncbi:MAG: dephospho-CoA kinase [Chitinophagaceae bacterium]
MLKIGLTGGIGSGKSTVARIFSILGIPVYDADEAARRLMNSDPTLKEEIIRFFGPSSYRDGFLDRSYIAGLVFNDAEKLGQLNALVHPATIRDAEIWIGQQNAPYVVKEAALLFESGAAAGLDVVVGVYAPSAIRLKRVMDRDGISAGEVRKRMDRQLDEDMKMKLCDHIVRNDEQELVIPQVLALHRLFLSGRSK